MIDNACELPPDADDIARAQISSLLDLMGEPQIADGPSPDWKHKCYAVSLRFFAERPVEVEGVGTHPPIVALCHGFPTINRPGHPHHGTVFGHAWVEITTTQDVPEVLQAAGWPETITHVGCWCPVTGTVLPLPLYYTVGNIDPEDVKRWTSAVEVFDILKSPVSELAGHVGNWAEWEHLDPAPVWNDA